MKAYTTIAAVVSVTLAATFAAQANVRVSGLFSDHMVLQRDAAVPVWGIADTGEKITVAFAGQTLDTTAGKDGKWSVTLAPMKANGTAQNLTITGNNKVELTDVLVGDVWLCSGQSNMGTGFARRDPPLDPGEMNLPLLRYLGIPNVTAVKPAEDAPALRWAVATKESVPTFPAAPWFFGQMLQQESGIPIGIIKANWGGAIVENWMAPDAMKDMPELRGLYNGFLGALKAYEDNLPKNTKLLADWVRAAETAVASSNEVPPIPVVDLHPVYAPPYKTGFFCMYNGMIHYLTKFPIKGVTWYQGESSADDGPVYYYKMLALINGWRKAWNNSGMPFYFVQLPSMGGACGLPDPTPKGWPIFREIQARCLAITNTGMAVTIDIGDEELHPRNKYDTGRRLAAIALAKDYGKKIAYAGPVYKRCEIRDGKVVLHFDNVGDGLMIGRKEGTKPVVADKQATLQEFAIAGADKRYHAADAVIDGNTVVVTSTNVPQPASVRYAYTFNPARRNLYGKNGLPVAPFRTDGW